LLPTYSTALFLDGLFFGLYVLTPTAKKYISFLFVLNAALLSVFFVVDAWDYRVLYITTFLLSCYALWMVGSDQVKRYGIWVSVLGGLLFLAPLREFMIRVHFYAENTAVSNKLIADVNHLANGQSVYFFTSNLYHVFPIMTYADNTHSVSRFSYFWALPGLVKQSYLPMDKKLYDQYISDKNLMVDMVAEDLVLKKPNYVFVDVLDHKSAIEGKFDYIQYFSTNSHFNHAWQKYHYLKTIADQHYRFNIYARE
jgi:hypothetical protein